MNVEVTNNAALDLGAITVSNHLNVAANGDITNSGALITGGVAGFNANGNAMTLNNADNDFNDLVIVNASSASVTDRNAIHIGSSQAGSAYSNLDSNVSGDMSITTLSGTITDEDSLGLSVTGIARLDSGAQDIVLDSVENDFTGVNIINAQNVTLVDSSALGLQSGSITGDLNVTARGDISNLDGGVSVAGVANFASDSNRNILLTHTDNNFNGELVFTTSTGSLNDISVVNRNSTLIAGVNVGNNLSIESSGNITQNGAFVVRKATTLTAGNADITLDANNELTALSIISAGHAEVNDTAISLTVNGINVSSGLDLNAVELSQKGNIVVQHGNASLNMSGSLSMEAGTSLVANTGDINVSSVESAYVSSLSAVNGIINLTTDKAINDNNAGGMNFLSEKVVLRAATGIGHNGEIETQAGVLDLMNSTAGTVKIRQTGDVSLDTLQNNGSAGHITFNSDKNIYFNPGSSVAALGAGDLLMTTSNGSFLGLGAADLTKPDITAQNAIFRGARGTFGSYLRSITLKVPGTVLIDTRGSFSPKFANPQPQSVVSEGIDYNIVGAINAVAGEQLVEIETLSEIDPAIFTALRNYYFQDVSIRLPKDQLYEDDQDDFDQKGL